MARESSEEQLKRLNKIVFWVVLLEGSGNAVGTLAFIWATVVLLGGFCSLLTYMDFWIATVMIFVEATRVFIRNDAQVYQRLFGSTSAFRLEFHRSSEPLRNNDILTSLSTMSISTVPKQSLMDARMKVISLVIGSHFVVARAREGTLLDCIIRIIISILVGLNIILAVSIGFSKEPALNEPKGTLGLGYATAVGFFIAWILGMLLTTVVFTILLDGIMPMRKPLRLCFNASTTLVLACLPFLQAILSSYHKYFSASVAFTLLYNVDFWNRNSSSHDILLHIHEAVILPILGFWSVSFPVPGISLELSFYTLFWLIAAALIDNLQIPVASLQVLLSFLRLLSLLGHEHHDYSPLPHDASPNLVPSIIVFFMLELCQGSSYILATILGFFSLPYRASIVRELGFPEEWGAKAVDLYYHQAYQARTEKGLFLTEKSTLSLDSFAIKSLGCTSSHEKQIVGLRILYNNLKQGDSRSNTKLITEIVEDAKNIITNIIGLIRYYLTDEKNSGDPDPQQETKTEQKEVACLCLEFVERMLAINGGKISARFRKELSDNPFFLDSLECILHLEDRQPEQKKLVMDIIARLALDETGKQEIENTQSIIIPIDKCISYVR